MEGPCQKRKEKHLVYNKKIDLYDLILIYNLIYNYILSHKNNGIIQNIDDKGCSQE